MSTKNIRLSKLAIELNCGISTLVNAAGSLGFSIDNSPNTKIHDDLRVELTRFLGEENHNRKLNEELKAKAENINNNAVTNLVNLGQLFEGKIFRIPDYQRGYSWSEKELDDLWKDLKDLTRDKKHFTGTISLEKISARTQHRFQKEFSDSILTEDLKIKLDEKEYDAFFIVDGQQRLTSLLILLVVLLEEFEKNNNEVDIQSVKQTFISNQNDFKLYRFGYEKDTPSHQHLLHDVFNDKSIQVNEPETIYSKNLKKAKQFFQGKIKTKKNDKGEEIDRFNLHHKIEVLNVIKESLLFHVLILDENQVDISMVFETLNYRGKPLSKLELLKNRLMFLSSKRFHSDKELCYSFRERITKTWLHLYEWLGKSKESINQIDDDSFLKAFWIMFFNHDERNESDFSSFESDLFDNKYKINEVSKNSLLSEDKLIFFLDSIEEAVKSWHYINYPNSKEVSNSLKLCDDFSYYLNLIKTIGRGEYVKPVIMALLFRDFGESDVNFKTQIIQLIERHNVVLFLINGKSSDTNRAQSWRFANKLFESRVGKFNNSKEDNGISIKGIKKFFDSAVNRNKKIENFKEHVHSTRSNNKRFWDWNGRDYILRQYEWYLNSTPLEERNVNEKYYVYPLYSDVRELSSDFKFPNHFFTELEHRKGESAKRLAYSLGNIFLSKKSYSKDRIFIEANITSKNEINYLYENGTKISSWTINRIRSRGVDILTFVEEQYEISLGDEDTKGSTILGAAKE